MKKYDKIFGIDFFCKYFNKDEKIEEMKIAKNSITTISLAIFTPAIITTKLAK